ncbi:MAG: hypothetical protein PPFGHCPK_01110 [Spiroplasma endosymbiont of Drosophila atripex]|nr:MAG: hypothetical protein PPFGHCPK_01110 [Spiroplasma endosymbiont of Drosophila atripex]
MKQWFNKNIAKITLALASVGAVTGTVGLIVGSVWIHESTQYKSFKKPNGEVVLGTTTIWWNKWRSPNMTDLYFASQKDHNEDIEWNGIYLPGYFK